MEGFTGWYITGGHKRKEGTQHGRKKHSCKSNLMNDKRNNSS
jgi:hypothetical protein